MNSSALSDDGKFSTRAIRGQVASEIEFNAPDPHLRNMNSRLERERDDRGDGMGLSTHVETSDKGSRRGNFHYRNEERIDEVEEEGSGRTSPPGTIGEGEAHEYMSENIESKIVQKIKAKTGNQSVIGAKDQTIQAVRNAQQNFEVDSEVTACSNFAVIREKIPLTNDNKHVQAFKATYDALF